MKQRLLIPAILLFSLAISLPASAQIAPPRSRPERPVHALFGGGRGNTEQQLMLNVSFGSGYDDDLQTEATGSGIGVPPTTAPRSGTFSAGSLGLDYSVSRERITASLYGVSNARYYPSLADPNVFTYAVGGQTTLKVTSKTDLSSSLSFGLQPNTQSIFLGIPIDGSTTPVPLDGLSWAIGRTTYQSLRGATDLSQRLTKRLSFTTGFLYYRTDALVVGQPQNHAESAHAGLAYEIARGLSLRAGYGIVIGQQLANPTGNQSRNRGRTIDAGLDFNRAISVTRRTKLTFGSGLAGIEIPNGGTRYFVTGNANLLREIGRSWTATGTYRRVADFYQILGQPVLSDTVSAGTSGLIGRRLMMTGTLGYGSGTVGITAGGSKYTTELASLGLQFGLTRILGLSLDYSYYHYLFEATAVLQDGLEREMNRQSVRLSLNLSAPLLTRARRPNAAR